MEKIYDISQTLVTLCIVCAVFTMLFAKTKFHGSINFVCSIIILLYLTNVCMPFYTALLNLVNVFPDNEQEESSPDITFEEYIKTASRGICEYVKQLTVTRFELNQEDVSVSVTVNTDDPQNIVLKNVTISIPGSAEVMSSEISRYLGDTLGCPCLIVLK